MDLRRVELVANHPFFLLVSVPGRWCDKGEVFCGLTPRDRGSMDIGSVGAWATR